ncbi:MAG: hypothetical protein FJ275_10360, partial [Planctomycetes bacterium]|nr:hypothetical protein [Planctomycetota bacterium]
DLERGRRLFFDARSTCYTCHEPPGGAGRLGPNLAERKTSLTDVEIVESILHPSKRISKEYGQVTAVLDDGKQVAGIRVEENDREIVLRDLLRPEPVRIPHDTIDELIESPVSLMPANLVRLLKSRREFNDLLRYVLETRSGR